MKIKNCLVVTAAMCAISSVAAAELQHNFNSPSFSGIGWSSHVLTLKQLEDQQKDKNKAAADAIKLAAERAAANTPQARFQASMETRIYSELAKRITDSLFGSSTGSPMCTPLSAGGPCGDIDLGGQNITWRIDGNNIVVRISEIANPNNYTELVMPYAAFKI
jgi:hypothetical protein